MTLTFNLGAEFEVLEHQLIDTQTDQRVDHVFLSPENDVHLEGESSVALYANDPLKPGRTYRVRLVGVHEGASFEKVWHFTTRQSASCSLLEQDCGVGQGCYATSNKPVCAWAGVQDEGSACVYQNDCAEGLTCAGQTCRRYCTISAGEHACSEICPQGHTNLNVPGAVGACKL